MESLEINKKINVLDAKMDDMQKALLILARLDERLINHSKSLDEMKEAHSIFFKRLRTLENTMSSNITKLSIGEKAMWAIGGVALSLFVWYVKK